MNVTDVLRERMQEPIGLQRMTALSLLVHGTVVAAVLLVPGQWFTQRAESPRPVMNITLGGGTPGPDSGGLTTIGGRPIQAVRPIDVPAAREPIRAPAAKAPEMTVPSRTARPVTGTAVAQAPPDARGRTPTRGDKPEQGSSVAETGVRGQGFGLSTGGGAGSGSRLDVADFCCPEYVALMLERIRGNWNARAEVPGETLVKFTIERDGHLVGAEIERSSGYAALDLNALRATISTRQLPPLPAAFPNPNLTVHLNFQYQR